MGSGKKKQEGESFEVGTRPVSRWRRIRQAVPGWIQVTTAALGLILLVAGIVVSAAKHFEHKDPIDVEIAEPAVWNPRLEYSEGGATPGTEPIVTVTVRNLGNTTAWVDEARITLLDGARIPVCFTQGGGPDVPYSKPYRVMMPEFPGTEKQERRRDLHVEVQPGTGARPLLRFAKRLTSTPGIYAIRVRFVVDPGHEILDAGRFVIAVPGPVLRGSFDLSLPENEAALTSDEFPRGNPEVSWCLRHNIAAVKRLAADPGLRSPEVKALSHLRLASSWPAVADHESPREAAEMLLASGDDLDSPVLAVEAAAATGDKAYEEEVRKRAVVTLIKRGEDELEFSGSLAASAAERALSLESSKAASDLLVEAKIAATEQEERLQAEMAAEESAVSSDPR